MDINILIGLLISLVPVIVAIIMTKRYNMLHGLVCFITTSAVLMICMGKFGDKLPEAIYGAADSFLVGSKALVEFFDNLLTKIPGLSTLLTNESYGIWVTLGVYVLIYVIFQIPSSLLRGKRKRAYKRMKNASKKY